MSDYQGWAVELCTLLDRIELVASGGSARDTIMGQPPRTLAERLHDYVYGEEIGDDIELAAETLDALQKLCLSRHDILKKHGFEFVLGTSQTGEDQ